MADEDPRSAEATDNHHHLQPEKMTGEHHDEKKQAHAPPYGGYGYNRRRQSICAFIVFILVLAGIAALIVWLLYRPHKPKFRVVSAAVYELNTTSPPFISSTMQFTVVTRNPNKRVTIAYDQLTAFVSYRNQAITPPVVLPPLLHETKSTVAMSPVLGGVTAVPAAAEVVNALMMDEGYGVVGLRVVIAGKLRYRSSVRRGRRYGINVRCDLFVGLKRGFVGQLPLLGSPPCTVDVM